MQLTAETMQTYDLKNCAVTQSNDSALLIMSISSHNTAQKMLLRNTREAKKGCEIENTKLKENVQTCLKPLENCHKPFGAPTAR